MRPLSRLRRSLLKGTHTAVAFAAGALRKEDPRRMYWSVYYPANFGDWIGPYLYLALTGREPWFGLPNSLSLGTVYMSAGSILGAARENCVVWGSGILSRTDSFPRPDRITAVRGPFSRERVLALGYNCPEVYGDPGLVLPHVHSPDSTMPRSYLGVVPHFREQKDTRAAFGGAESVRVIDVRLPVDQVIDQIASCERILSSSLHGLVVAHAYRIPAGWAFFGKKMGGDGVKYLDHYASLGVWDPDCLEDALRRPPQELAAFADAQPCPNPEPLLAPLLNACPFPAQKSFVRSSGGRGPQPSEEGNN